MLKRQVSKLFRNVKLDSQRLRVYTVYSAYDLHSAYSMDTVRNEFASINRMLDIYENMKIFLSQKGNFQVHVIYTRRFVERVMQKITTE